MLSLLVLGSVWLTCRSEYRGGFRRGLLISQGTDSVRTNLAGLRRERSGGGKRGWRVGGERWRDIKAWKEHLGSRCACKPLWNRSPNKTPGTSGHLAPAARFGAPPCTPAAAKPSRDVGGLKASWGGMQTPRPRGCNSGRLSSHHGHPTNQGDSAASGGGTVNFLAATFWGKRKVSARSILLFVGRFSGWGETSLQEQAS